MKFLALETEAFGLDINDSSLKIIKLGKRRSFLQPVSFSEKALTDGMVSDGVIQNEDAVAEIIKSAMASAKGEKLKTKYAVVSLPEIKSFSQVIQMPKMEKKELKPAVVFEAENYIPLPIDQVYLDFQIINPITDHLDHLDVLIIATEKTIIDSYASCLKKAGIIPFALEVETQAIARALIRAETSLAPVILLDVGEKTANFIAFSGHSVRFTSSAPVSSNLEEFASNIKKYADFYSEHSSHEHLPEQRSIEKLILSGKAESIEGLDSVLQKTLNIPVEFGNPFINFSPKLKRFVLPQIKQNSLSFVTATGLALRGTRNNFYHD